VTVSSIAKDAVMGEVVQVIEYREAPYGYTRMIVVKILEGPNKGTPLRKKVSGFVRVGDIIPLLDIETEAAPIKDKRRK
jgi:ribosomal protein S28E/S33